MPLFGQSLNAKEERSFDQLYQSNMHWMFRYALKILGNHQDAEDAVQEAFIYLANHFHRYKDRNEQALQAALAVLVRSRSLNILRDRKENRDIDEYSEYIKADNPPLHHGLIWDEAFKALPPTQREIVLLHIADGYSLREISDLMDMKYDAVRQNWQRARKTLYQFIHGE